tara:strand:+ start:74 stop:478 length:405 start_codon:yes stop_codon:yes gene_type:complete
MKRDCKFIATQLKESMGESFGQCPTVNGFPASMIESADHDAATIIEILDYYTRFNVAQLALSKSSSEAGRSSLIEIMKEKDVMDARLAEQGIVAEAEAHGGQVFNILYTTPRKKWNPTTRHLKTVVLPLSDHGD